MPQNNTSHASRTKNRVSEPRRYKVIMYNDDFTTMDFVVKMLITVFHKTQEEATRLMLTVHHEESAVIGMYSYDMAVSKANKAMNMARKEGFPFRLDVEVDDYELPF